MAGDTMDGNARRDLRISLVKSDPSGVHAPHHACYVFDVESLGEHLMHMQRPVA
jgi:hypothetical protein